jgi:hypothetical protein
MKIPEEGQFASIHRRIDRWQGKPLYEAIIPRPEMGIAGTMLRGLMVRLFADSHC